MRMIDKKNYFLVILISIICFSVLLIFWRLFIAYERNLITKSIEQVEIYGQAELTNLLVAKVGAINRLLDRGEYANHYKTEVWKHDIHHYFTDYPALKRIIVEKPGKQPLFFVRDTNTEKTSTHDLKTCHQLIKAKGENLHGKQSIQFVMNGEILCISKMSNHMIALFDVRKLFNILFDFPIWKSYGVELRNAGTIVFLNDMKTDFFFRKQWGISKQFTLFNNQWDLEIWANEKTVGEQYSFVLRLYFIFGCLLTVFLVVVIRLWQLSTLQNQLVGQKTEALEFSNQALDEFVYIVSHDLKEPVRGINNLANFVLQDYQDKLDTPGQEQLKTLQQLSQRIGKLINTLLIYSRVRRADLLMKSCDVGDIIQEKCELLHSYLKEKNAEVILLKKMPTIICDEARLGEVFQNLITNAIKYNEHDAKKIEISYEKSQNETIFSIKDNGIGIPADQYEQVFKMFKRLHGRKEYGGGTGAGLAIVKRIVERHHGKIWIESTIGHGTTFYFNIKTR